MKLGEILLIVACAAVVIGVIITSVIRRKQGKCSCDCGGNCSHCSACRQTNKSQNEK